MLSKQYQVKSSVVWMWMCVLLSLLRNKKAKGNIKKQQQYFAKRLRLYSTFPTIIHKTTCRLSVIWQVKGGTERENERNCTSHSKLKRDEDLLKRESVSSDFQTPRRELKIERVAEYFWRNSSRLEIRWNTVLNVWYIF